MGKGKEEMTLFKILCGDRSPIMNNFIWDLPKEVDGKWVPGEWSKPTKPNVYHSGYHLTNNPTFWRFVNLSPSVRDVDVYHIETRGAVDSTTTGDVVSVESLRLLRPLTQEELTPHGVFLSGEHHRLDPQDLTVVGEKAKLVCGDVGKLLNFGSVILKGNIGTIATIGGHGILEITGSGSVYCMEDATVVASGSVSIQASHRSTVKASDKSRVECNNNTRVFLSGEACGVAFGGSVVATEDARVTVYEEGVRVHASGNARVSYYPSQAKNLILTREGNATLAPVGMDPITTGTGINGWVYQGDCEWKRQ